MPKKSNYFSDKRRKFIPLDGQLTTGQIIAEDFGVSEVPDLAKAIDRALDKELQYGIHLGRVQKANSGWTSIMPAKAKEDDKELHATKSVKNDGRRTKRSSKKV